MTPGPTALLAHRSTSIRFEDLPRPVVERARQVIADALACGMAGSAIAPEIIQPMARYARTLRASGRCSVIFDGKQAAQPVAALLNATTIHTLDYDDTHLDAVAHLGAPVVPAALAAVEVRRGNGKDLIEAVVAGFEIGGRIGRAVMPDHYQRWHATSSIGGIAAAAATARAMGLGPEETEIALGFAADDAGGTRYCIKVGDFSKSLHAGSASWKGSQAALLAAAGASGPTGLLEHEVGFLWAYTDERDAPRLVREAEAPLGDAWEMLKADLKAHPCILSSHTAIDGAQTIVREHGLTLDDIDRIVLYQRAYSKRHGLNYHPNSVMAARLSVPYCVVIGVVDGRVGIEQFGGERYFDPTILHHMEKVTVEPDLSLRERYTTSAPTRVEITTTSGKRFVEEVGYARGSHQRPLSLEEFNSKQRELLGYRMDATQIDQWMQFFGNLEQANDLGSIAEFFQAGTEKVG